MAGLNIASVGHYGSRLWQRKLQRVCYSVADDDEDDDKQDRYLRIPEIYINTPNSRQW